MNWGAAVASATAIRRKHCSRGERPIKFLGSMCELFVICSPPAVAMLFDSISHLECPAAAEWCQANCLRGTDLNERSGGARSKHLTGTRGCEQNLRLFEIADVVVRLDYVASLIENPNHGIV